MRQINLYRYWIQVIIFLTFFQYGLYYFIHRMSFLNEIDDILILLLFFYLLFLGWRTKSVSHRNSMYLPIFIILIVIGVISAILNQAPILNFILGMKGYFLYFILFYCVYWINFSNDDLEKILKFSLRLFWIELAIALAQLVYAIIHNNLTGDSIFGSFNGPNYFGYAIFALLYFAVYQVYFNKKKWYFIYAMLLLALLFMSSARFAIFLFPLVFLALNPIRSFSKLNLMKMLLMLLLIISLPLLINNSFILKNGKMQDYFTPSFWSNHFSNTENTVTSGSARNLWYPLTLDNLNKYSYNPLIGFGPGMYASLTAMRLMPSSNLLIYDYFNQLAYGLDAQVDSQIIPIWGELGYLGLIAIYALLICMLVRMIYINWKTKDNFIKAISSTAAGYSLFFIIGFYIQHMLESQTTALLLFLFVGMSEAQYFIEKRNKNVNGMAVSKK